MSLQSDVKAIGRELTIKRTSYGEYRVTYALEAIKLVNDGISHADAIERAEQCAYYTDDKDDALQTARKMHERFVKFATI